ncbi:type II secretion system major pseudopilin GspG [Thalassotalea euphylliae]|uniref:Type II secretion system core protein G n=1 Tax=Thalassotalea euphylliae TaxID=1655234 RepID=A0A3E0U1Z2_9GAMM|nr:type II secretion system major pseudopilin GspG [Thalassotalea euphylliae]REL30235.1 type II secretion system protein GspG [Thalassotalea euphylliae]
MKKNQGFTLIELMIVVVIIGLLASLVAPEMFGKVSSTKRKTAATQMNMFQTSLDTYRLDLGTYPNSLNELVSSEKTGWDGPYLPKAVPLDPWGHPYHYELRQGGSSFELLAYGSDGQLGGEGESEDVVHQ